MKTLSNHIIVVTSLEEPRVYFTQESFDETITSLRLLGAFQDKRCGVFDLKPDLNPDHLPPPGLKAIRLLKVGSTDDKHPADSHFQEALSYLEHVNPKYQGDFLRKWKGVIDQQLERSTKAVDQQIERSHQDTSLPNVT